MVGMKLCCGKQPTLTAAVPFHSRKTAACKLVPQHQRNLQSNLQRTLPFLYGGGKGAWQPEALMLTGTCLQSKLAAVHPQPCLRATAISSVDQQFDRSAKHETGGGADHAITYACCAAATTVPAVSRVRCLLSGVPPLPLTPRSPLHTPLPLLMPNMRLRACLSRRWLCTRPTRMWRWRRRAPRRQQPL